jgi:hypothetical protein
MDSTTFAYPYAPAMLPQGGAAGIFVPTAHSVDVAFGPTRRQNRSCDQCRKGKRKCDAVIPKEWPIAEKEFEQESRFWNPRVFLFDSKQYSD